MQNPNQILTQMNQIKKFYATLQGDPEQLARQQLAGMSQQELNALQQQTNEIYQMACQMGIMK